MCYSATPLSSRHPAVLVAVGRRRLIGSIAAGALFAQLLAGATPGTAIADDPRPTVIDVDASAFDLSVDVRNAPLGHVLQIVGERAAVVMTVYGDASTRVTDSFTGLPLEDGIRRLARGHSVTVAYGTSTSAPTQPTLTAVWVAIRSAAPSAVSSAAPSDLEVERAEPRVSEAVIESASGSWTAVIHRLADEAAAGNEVAVARLADLGTTDPETGLRQQAVAALARLKTPAIEPALVSALSDVDAAVRVRAVRGLRTFGTDTAVRSLENVLVSDADPEVRLAALAAAGSLSGPRMLAMLTNAAADPSAAVRETAIRWLAWWRTRAPVNP